MPLVRVIDPWWLAVTSVGASSLLLVFGWPDRSGPVSDGLTVATTVSLAVAVLVYATRHAEARLMWNELRAVERRQTLTIELARLHGIETLFFLTEPRLASHFKKLGVRIQTIGPAIEHHGLRIPSMMSTSTVINDLKTILRPLYHTIAKEIEAGLTDASSRATSEPAGRVLQAAVTK